MWTSTSMGVPESVLLSVMGLSVVMVTLIILALVILVFAKVMGSSNAAAQSAQSAPRPIPDPPGISDEVCSMILAVICEELHASPEEINVTSIKELK